MDHTIHYYCRNKCKSVWRTFAKTALFWCVHVFLLFQKIYIKNLQRPVTKRIQTQSALQMHTASVQLLFSLSFFVLMPKKQNWRWWPHSQGAAALQQKTMQFASMKQQKRKIFGVAPDCSTSIKHRLTGHSWKWVLKWVVKLSTVKMKVQTMRKSVLQSILISQFLGKKGQIQKLCIVKKNNNSLVYFDADCPLTQCH